MNHCTLILIINTPWGCNLKVLYNGIPQYTCTIHYDRIKPVLVDFSCIFIEIVRWGYVAFIRIQYCTVLFIMEQPDLDLHCLLIHT